MATPREQLAEVLRKSRIDAGYESHGALARSLTSPVPWSPRRRIPLTRSLVTRSSRRGRGQRGAGLDVLTDLAQRARSGPPGWFAKWADIEARASLIRWFEPLLIPGLIQTESYARAVLAWKPTAAAPKRTLRPG
jgi:Domain of unknown function (DUF5753)